MRTKEDCWWWVIVVYIHKVKKESKWKMKTNISLYDKENKIISWCALQVLSCFLLNNNCYCMRYREQCTLYHIRLGWISYDNIHWNSKAIFNDMNINSTSNVTKEKVKNFSLYMCFTFQNNSCNNILKNIMDCNPLIPTLFKLVLNFKNAYPINIDFELGLAILKNHRILFWPTLGDYMF
jgi:hypothetical protein